MSLYCIQLYFSLVIEISVTFELCLVSALTLQLGEAAQYTYSKAEDFEIRWNDWTLQGPRMAAVSSLQQLRGALPLMFVD